MISTGPLEVRGPPRPHTLQWPKAGMLLCVSIVSALILHRYVLMFLYLVYICVVVRVHYRFINLIHYVKMLSQSIFEQLHKKCHYLVYSDNITSFICSASHLL